MLVFYSIDLNSLDNISPWYYKCFGFPAYRCIVIRTLSKSALTDVYGLMGFLVVLMICEFACSIASVALSCKAYSKYCNTCNADDCCTCLGCCECDATPLNYYQVTQCFIPIALTAVIMVFMLCSVEHILRVQK